MKSNDNSQIEYLIEKARWLREKTLRLHGHAPETRIASSLSVIEIFIALYYGGILQFSADPNWEGRDRLIISKGHGSFCLYPILADIGYFDQKELDKICQNDSFLGAIPDSLIPGYETTNGSLGHGLGVGCGVALALKYRKSPQKVIVIAGDGELNEGAVWEAVMFASFHKLNNLILIIDDNKLSMLGFQKKIIQTKQLEEQFAAFDWHASSVDGHNINDLIVTLQDISKGVDRPAAIMAETIKGKGVKKLENKELSHVMSLNSDEIENAILELST